MRRFLVLSVLLVFTAAGSSAYSQQPQSAVKSEEVFNTGRFQCSECGTNRLEQKSWVNQTGETLYIKKLTIVFATEFGSWTQFDTIVSVRYPTPQAKEPFGLYAIAVALWYTKGEAYRRGIEDPAAVYDGFGSSATGSFFRETGKQWFKYSKIYDYAARKYYWPNDYRVRNGEELVLGYMCKKYTGKTGEGENTIAVIAEYAVGTP